MKDFETLAAAYYRDFESYRFHVGLFSWHTLALVLALGFFMWSLTNAFEHTGSRAHSGTGNVATYVLIIAEGFLLGTWAVVKRSQRVKVLGMLNSRWGTACKDLSDTQAEWLRRSVDVPPSEYIEIAKDISESSRLRRAHKVSISLKWRDFARLIFDPDSKARILSLVIFLLSLISLLIIRSVEQSQSPVELFWAEGFNTYMYIVLLGGLMLWLSYVALRVGVEFLMSFILVVLDALSSGKAVNMRATNRLILALIDNHEIPGVRPSRSP